MEALETTTETKITPPTIPAEEDLDSIRSFLAKTSDKKLADKEKQTHKIALGEGLVLAKLIASKQHEGFMQFASENGKKVGFQVCAIDNENNVIGTFIGVDWNSKGKGIGSSLLKARHEVLKKRGILSYETGVWEGSTKMFDRAGIRYEITETENNQKVAKIYVD